MSHGVAVVGCGLIGRKRVAALPEGAELRAVFDPVSERADALAASVDASVRVAASLEDAVATDGVDLVVVATTHAHLAPAALAALDAGRHVLVEKPGADHLGALEAVGARARETGRIVRVGFNHRFHPAIRRAHELVRSGAHGPVTGVRARYGHGGRVGYEREWRADRAVSGGGELIDQGLHLIDLTRHFAGDVELAFSELRTDFWPMEVEDNAYLALRSETAFAWLHASWTEWKNLFSFEVVLERAKVEVFGLGGSYGTERVTCYEMAPEMGPPATTVWEFPGADRSWDDEMVDVLGALDGQAGVGATVDDGIEAFRVVDAAYRRAGTDSDAV